MYVIGFELNISDFEVSFDDANETLILKPRDTKKTISLDHVVEAAYEMSEELNFSPSESLEIQDALTAAAHKFLVQRTIGHILK